VPPCPVHGALCTRLPMIGILFTGGTISMKLDPATGAAVPALGADDILAQVPGLSNICDVESEDFSRLPGPHVTPEQMWRLARRAAAWLERPDSDGLVITHGTDTIEETAYALALMVPRGRPIVFTGAMRNPTLPGTDGPANLLSACLVAAGEEAAGLGPLIVLNDELHTARFAAKLHTTRVSTIGSPGAGPIGDIVERRVNLWFRPAYEDYLGLPDSIDGSRVELVRVAADPSEALLRAAAERAPHGIVVEGTGGGHLPPALLPALDDAIGAGIPVVVATRCASGANLEETYGMPGGETDLRRRGALPAGLLSGHKARLRLIVGRALGLGPDTLFPVR
jgi:L-asparaginase